MTPRRVVAWGIALAVLVLVNAFFVSWQIGTRLEKALLQRKWTVPVSGVQTLVLARFQPGAAESLAVLATGAVRLISGDGQVTASLDVPAGISASATGDVDVDGADEVWIVRKSGPPYVAEALGGDLEAKLRIPLEGLSLPVRILPVDLDGDGRCELVAADDKGGLRAYDRKGGALWGYAPPSGASAADREVRGLDDVKAGKERRVALAYSSGRVTVFDRTGRQLLQKEVGKLRRLRSFDVDGDGAGDLLLGTEGGQYLAQAAQGAQLAASGLGEAVTEIRAVEVDGDPRRAEVFLGGKRGAFAVLRGNELLGRGSLGSRVSSARGIDTDGDGRDEIFVGTENGRVHALAARGNEIATVAFAGKPETLGFVVSPLRDRLAVVGGGTGLVAFRLSRSFAPAWYSPWTAAVLAWLAIAMGAAVILRLPPEAQPAAPRPGPDPAQARAQALEAAADRIASWVASGKLRAEDAEDRLQQIRRRIAESAKAKRAPMATSPPPPRPRG